MDVDPDTLKRIEAALAAGTATETGRVRPGPPAAPPAGETEAAFQARVIALAKATGWTHYHTHDSRRSAKGFPDLVLVHPGRRVVIFVELKSAAGKLRPEQEAWFALLRAAGQRAEVWFPADWPEIMKTLTGG